MKVRNPLVLCLVAVLIAVGSFFFGVKYGKQTVTKAPSESQSTESSDLSVPATQPGLLPKEGTVSRIIDGDTVELVGGKVVRFVGANAPEVNQPSHDEALEFTKKMVLGKKVTLEYEKGYEQDKFDRLLAYVFVNGKNMSVELVKAGLAKVSIYEKRRKLIYQDQLLEAQNSSQKSKVGIWKVN